VGVRTRAPTHLDFSEPFRGLCLIQQGSAPQDTQRNKQSECRNTGLSMSVEENTYHMKTFLLIMVFRYFVIRLYLF